MGLKAPLHVVVPRGQSIPSQRGPPHLRFFVGSNYDFVVSTGGNFRVQVIVRGSNVNTVQVSHRVPFRVPFFLQWSAILPRYALGHDFTLRYVKVFLQSTCRSSFYMVRVLRRVVSSLPSSAIVIVASVCVSFRVEKGRGT